MTYPPGPGQYPYQPQYPPLGEAGQQPGAYPQPGFPGQQLPGQPLPGQYPPLGEAGQNPGAYPQPGFPGQHLSGQHLPGQYPPPQGKQKKTGLWIGLGALAVVVVVAAVVGLAVAFGPAGSRSAGWSASSKPSLIGRPQSEYVALLPKQDDFGAGWSVSDDSAPVSEDAAKIQQKFLSQLTATPAGCGLLDLMDKSKSVSGKSQKLAGVKGERAKTGSPASGAGDSTQLTFVISAGESYDQGVKALRDYIAQCSSATMQGDVSEGDTPISVTVKIDFTEVKLPSVQADKSFGAQLKSTISINGMGHTVLLEQSQVIEAALVRGVVVATSTNDLGQTDLQNKLFSATVERANKA